MQNQSIYILYVKRLLDIIISSLLLIILSPLLLFIAILVRFKLGTPVIFKQSRPGKNEIVFDMYKFRTMTNERDEFNNLLSDEERLTNFGKMLRSTSLDELPELWNILKGDMSVVGPRPQLIRDMWFMTDEQRKRHQVLPGLTGFAQISGRNRITWEEKLSLDLEYVEEVSFLFDLKIFFGSLKKVILKEDIVSTGFETAEDLGEYLLREKKITKDDFNKIMEKYCDG